ncbi:hypothetical protein K8T06_17325 [bacterium]|nr:hypothetical protein [bacterium]
MSRLFQLSVLIIGLCVVFPINASFVPFSQDALSGDLMTHELLERGDIYKITVKTPGIHVTGLIRDGMNYQQISINGGGAKGNTGEPELPFKGLFVEIPHGVEVKLTCNAKWLSLPGNYRVLPRQLPQPESGDKSDVQDFVVDNEFYEKDMFVPQEAVIIGQDACIRGRRVIFLEMTPVRYNPGLGIIEGASELTVELHLSGNIDIDAEADKFRLASPAFEKQAQSLIANYKSIKVAQRDGSRDGADYLIITADAFETDLASLVSWKTIKGYQTELRTLTDISASTSTHIQTFLQTVYNTWSPVPEFVMLVGDIGDLPSRTESPDAYGNSFPSDLGYSLLQGSDHFPDIFLSRISVETSTQCAIVVNKMLAYDRTPEINNWYNSALIAAYLQDYDDYNCEADRWFFETGTHVMDYLENTVGMSIYTAMCTDSYSSCDPLAYRTDSSFYPHRPAHPTNVPAAYRALFTTSSQATSNITSAINSGVGIVQHRDHGGETGWGDPAFYVSHVNSLSNGSRSPAVFSINCLTGAIDHSSDCFAEAFLRKNNGGCAGIMAATRVSYSGYNDLLTHGIYTSFWPGYDSSHSGNIYSNSFNLCEAMNFGKYYMYMYQGSGSATLYSFRLFHWFGDPEMLVRTDIPQAPSATLPGNIPAGTTQITIPCSDNGALVGISQNGTLLGSAIVSGGQAVVNLSSAVRLLLQDTILIQWSRLCLVASHLVVLLSLMPVYIPVPL